jgi:FtsP/CotA-like multicopper oxidase with cupredoxin domain
MKIDFKACAIFLVLAAIACAVPALAFVQYGTGTNVTRNHYGASDGLITMADGREVYIFGFVNISSQVKFNNLSTANAIRDKFHANFSAPTLDFKEGKAQYLNLSTLGMFLRPDLFDPHTIHFHGFPNAASVYDGEPMASLATNQGADFTYYYLLRDPGTYMFHCHVEATEHMEMGMLGNLVVRPLQDDIPNRPPVCTDGSGRDPNSFIGFIFNDGDCSTGYDSELIVQFADIDPAFHDADSFAQPLPFADFNIRYPLLNGRGYPDTVKEGEIVNSDGYGSQKIHALPKPDIHFSAAVNQRIVIRLSNLSIQNFVTLEMMGLPMQVVAKDAKFLRRPNGRDLRYNANSVFVGPGESADMIITVPAGTPPGTYYLFSRELQQLNADLLDRSGAMTEIRVLSP